MSTAGQLPGGFDPIHRGHADVHQHHVGLELATDANRFDAVGPCR